jgi:hypothetical protein
MPAGKKAMMTYPEDRALRVVPSMRILPFDVDETE